MSEILTQKPKWFKILLVITSIYFIFRVIAQQAVHLGLLDLGLDPEVTLWFGRDLRIVVTAALRLAERGNTYYLGEWGEGFDIYNYTPFYALLISQIATRLPFNIHAFLHGFITIAAYIFLFLSWLKIFPKMGLSQVNAIMISFLPLWLIYEGFWSDLILLNMYIPLTLVASWLFVFIWQEKLIPAAILLVLILQVKPQWAFALALPLVLGNFSFFIKLLLLTVSGYLGVILATTLWLGWDYGIVQYQDYYTMLSIAPLKITWHGPDEFIGYDHSIAQIYFYLFGYTPEAWLTVRFIKLALIIPFGIIVFISWLRCRRGQVVQLQPSQILEVYFALYFVAFIWLNLVWEITFAIILFIYLWGMATKSWEKWVFAVPFLIYAVADLWRNIGVPLAAAILGEKTLSTQGIPVWADPLFQLPIIMIVVLTGYILMSRRFLLATRTSDSPAIPERQII